MTAPTSDRLADIDRVFATLGMSEAAGAWRDRWALSGTSYDPGRVLFLEPGFVREACRTLEMSGEVCGALEASAAAVRARPELARLAWHWHCVYLSASHRLEDLPPRWTPLPEKLMEQVGLFDALVLLSALPRVRQLHRQKEIPNRVTLETLSDLELWIRSYRSRHDHWGLDGTQWLVQHFTGRLYRLGRLQFNFSRFRTDFHAFRSHRDGRVVLLAGDGMCFRRDGFFNDTNGIPDPEGAWTARFAATDETIVGHLVSPGRGIVLREPVELRASEWTEILSRDDRTLGVHIPAAGPMDHAACGESFREAVRFFPRHVPEYPPKAFACGSWLLDRQFEDYLAPTANIVRFLQEYYLYPLPGASDHSHFHRVFGGPVADLDSAPQDTSLRRAIIRHVKEGKRWHGGGGLIFAENLDWGRQVYRTQETRWPAEWRGHGRGGSL